MLTRRYHSPCGELLLGVSGNSVCLCDWIVDGRIEKTLGRIGKFINSPVKGDNPELLQQVCLQLDEYFAKKRLAFDLPLNPLGTLFQQEVWGALQSIPYSATSTYREIAETISRPKAVRAVANAIGANPLSILIPCHRVIASDGTPAGYAGGLYAKKYLLELESLPRDIGKPEMP